MQRSAHGNFVIHAMQQRQRIRRRSLGSGETAHTGAARSGEQRQTSIVRNDEIDGIHLRGESSGAHALNNLPRLTRLVRM